MNLLTNFGPCIVRQVVEMVSLLINLWFDTYMIPIDFLHWWASFNRSLPKDFVRLDQDILSPLAGKKQLYTYETTGFWEQIKTPG